MNKALASGEQEDGYESVVILGIASVFPLDVYRDRKVASALPLTWLFLTLSSIFRSSVVRLIRLQELGIPIAFKLIDFFFHFRFFFFILISFNLLP